MDRKMRTKTIRQTAVFKATPHEVYELLADSKLHSEFTGEKATVSRRVGGKVDAYDGWIKAKNLELVKDKKIVQSWRGADWPKGHYSTVTFKITKSGKRAKLEFVQTGVPADVYSDIKEGWKEHYWEKMKDFLA